MGLMPMRTWLSIRVILPWLGLWFLTSSGQTQPGKPPLFQKDAPPGLGLKKGGPKVGEKAPDFQLKVLDAEKTFKLSENFDKRPTVLIFHSFT
jgi:hypothetical protein